MEVRLHAAPPLKSSESKLSKQLFQCGPESSVSCSLRPSLGLPDGRTADGFEIAIYDLMGQALGMPVHVIPAGASQERVAVSYWTGQRTIEDLVRVGSCLNIETPFRFLLSWSTGDAD